MRAKKQLTPEQAAASAERRARFYAIAKQPWDHPGRRVQP